MIEILYQAVSSVATAGSIGVSLGVALLWRAS